MSGPWMKAARRFTGYSSKRRGDLSSTSPQACRAVLNRLAQRANEAGVVAIYTADLVQATGYSDRAVRYALRQLEADGWLWPAVRGQGSRAREFRGTPAPSVYVLRPLPQDDVGTVAPAVDSLRQAWTRYALGDMYRSRPQAQREAIRQAVADAQTPGLMPVDNSRPTGKEGTTYRQPVAASLTRGTRSTARRSGHLRAVPDALEHPCLRPGTDLPDLAPFSWPTDHDRAAALTATRR